jgi:hypothetical protein
MANITIISAFVTTRYDQKTPSKMADFVILQDFGAAVEGIQQKRPTFETVIQTGQWLADASGHGSLTQLLDAYPDAVATQGRRLLITNQSLRESLYAAYEKASHGYEERYSAERGTFAPRQLVLHAMKMLVVLWGRFRDSPTHIAATSPVFQEVTDEESRRLARLHCFAACEVGEVLNYSSLNFSTLDLLVQYYLAARA